MSKGTGSIPVEDLRRWEADATQRLLGYTIGITDEQWHEPSPLPGWSRAHVASHLSQSAAYLRSVVDAANSGRPQPAQLSTARRVAALEAGADRTGLELQIDLDTSAGELQDALDEITDWSAPVELRGTAASLADLALSRLHEVCLHHYDLDRDFNPDSIDPAAAAWLVRWVVDALADADLPAIRVEGDSLATTLGSGGEPIKVSGSDARLWAWLCGRLPAAEISGADGLQPALIA